MDKKTINEDEVFEINPNYYVAVEYFGKQKVKVVVVDDFYKNPYLVRQLALDIPASNKASTSISPSVITHQSWPTILSML